MTIVGYLSVSYTTQQRQGNMYQLFTSQKTPCAWWRHQMKTFCALLAFCAGNSPVPGEFPHKRPVTRSFDVLFDLRLNKQLSKQSWGWWFETLSRPLWRHSNEYLKHARAMRIHFYTFGRHGHYIFRVQSNMYMYSSSVVSKITNVCDWFTHAFLVRNGLALHYLAIFHRIA